MFQKNQKKEAKSGKVSKNIPELTFSTMEEKIDSY